MIDYRGGGGVGLVTAGCSRKMPSKIFTQSSIEIDTPSMVPLIIYTSSGGPCTIITTAAYTLVRLLDHKYKSSKKATHIRTHT